MQVKYIRKRDGRLVTFQPQKITHAIHRAFFALGIKSRAKYISKLVIDKIEKKFVKRIPSVEDAQDIVIEFLEKKGYKSIARAYADYRKKKAEIREARKTFKIEPKLTVNAWEVLKKRYLLRDEHGNIIETPEKMFRRVARTVSKHKKRLEEQFYKMMSRLEFLPNSPTLFNAGAPLKQLSACFVIPVGDSLKSIFNAVKLTALIEQTGGGIGFDFSSLRPRGDIVKSTKGVASGPVSFMRVFDVTTDVIKAGGKRRGAMMGILRIDHPDIIRFIKAKNKPILTNFNLSVAITDNFMEALRKNTEYELINPRTRKAIGKLKAKSVWKLIVKNAWKTGDPGLIFIDEINRHNPIPKIGKISATNPCGEQPLLPYESCNLGSINLSKMVKKKGIDWNKLRRTVRLAVHFLDNVIDVNRYPHPQIEKITKANRKIGLGVMGFADMLIMLGIPYNSKRAIKLAERLMKFINENARKESEKIGKARGSFPNFKKSIFLKNYRYMRNATLTTIAPTGSISIIAGCSSGIEPLFAIAFMRNVLEGTRLFEVNPLFESMAKEKNFYSGHLLERVAKTGSIKGMKNIPKQIKHIFLTALDIKPEWHVRMQAIFQKYTDNAVSKTINLPHNAKPRDVERAFLLAHKLGCKGITVFRYGSKPQQVLYIGKPKHLTAGAEYSGGCPTPICPF